MNFDHKKLLLVLNVALIILSALSAQGIHLGLDNTSFQTVLAMLGGAVNGGAHAIPVAGDQ